MQNEQCSNRNGGLAGRKAVIFDVDGVLIDSYLPHFQSWQSLARETGVAFSEADFAASFGRTSREIIRQHWADAVRGGGEQLVNCLDERKETLFRNLIRADFPAMPGALSLIRELHEAGFALGVGSSGPPENVQLVLARLECRRCFDAVVTGRDVARGKPDPQVFQIAARRLNVQPVDCVVIEDAPAGIQAAHAAGMKAIALMSTGRRRNDFAQWRPELIVQALGELTSIVVRELW